jgi:branched-chain amino acid transport system substrate-binding protein
MQTARRISGILLVLSLCVAVGSAWAEGQKDKASDLSNAKVVKIGYIAPFTGAAAEFGTNGWRGIELAMEEANKTGIEIKGQKYIFQIVRYDSRCEPTEAVANIRKLVMEDKVVAILGDHCSSCCMGIAPLCDEFKVPGLTIECVATGVTNPGHEFFFRMIPPSALQAPLAAPKLAKTFNAKSVSFLAINDDYGRSMAASYEESLGKIGVKTLSKQYFERGNTDFTNLLTKIKAESPDFVYYVGVIPEGVMILKQARELGLLPGIKFVGSAEMAEIEMAQLGGADVVEGTYAVAITGAVPETFVQKIKARYNAPIHYAMMMGNDAFNVMRIAIERAQSLDPVAIKDALKKTNYDGLQAPGIKFEDFDGYKNQARWAPFLAKWVDGKRIDE